MSTYRLHSFCPSGNAYKVALYLNCAGLAWEGVEVDFFGGQNRKPDWRDDVNAMGEVPVLETDGKRLTQSGARMPRPPRQRQRRTRRAALSHL